jgi:general stress protein 26
MSIQLPPPTLEFITQNVTGVLAAPFDDGVHAAAMEYAHGDATISPLTIYFMTHGHSHKYTALKHAPSCNAAFVIGTSRDQKATLQMRGVLSDVAKAPGLKLEEVKSLYYSQFPKSKEYETPDSVYLQLVVGWWRWTDYSVRPPKVVEVQ